MHGLMNRVFEVIRVVKLPDGQGGWTEELGVTERSRGRLSRTSDRYIVYMTGLRRMQKGDMLKSQKHTLRVIAIREPSEPSHHIEYLCEEVE